jgi:hypothetical protein
MKKIVCILVLLFTVFSVFAHDGTLIIEERRFTDGTISPQYYEFWDCTTLEPYEFQGARGITSLWFHNTDSDPNFYISSITIIPEGCFRNNKIEMLLLPGSVKRIEAKAFENSQKLLTLHLQEGLEYIGEDAFNNCILLKQIRLPRSLKKMSAYAFNIRNPRNNTGVERIWIGDDVELESKVVSGGSYNFESFGAFGKAYLANNRKAGWYGYDKDNRDYDPYNMIWSYFGEDGEATPVRFDKPVVRNGR